MGGHTVDKADEEPNIAAQRAMLNFAFQASGINAIIADISVPPVMAFGETYNLTGTATGGRGGFIFEWSSDCPGSFSNRFSATPTFTAATVTEPTECTVLLQVTDDSGRRIGHSRKTVIIVPALTPPVAIDDIATTLPGTSITLSVLDNDYDVNLDLLTLTSLIGSANTGNGIFTDNGDGTVAYISNYDFRGTDQIDYKVCDLTPVANGGPFCDVASIIISVNWTD